MAMQAERAKLQDAAAATGNGAALNVAGSARLGVQVSGTFVATVTFETLIDGTNWVATAVNPVGGGAAVTTATAPGLFTVSIGGLAQFRARVTWTSGAVTVDALVTEAAT